jgi:hypothetical protein
LPVTSLFFEIPASCRVADIPAVAGHIGPSGRCSRIPR